MAHPIEGLHRVLPPHGIAEPAPGREFDVHLVVGGFFEGRIGKQSEDEVGIEGIEPRPDPEDVGPISQRAPKHGFCPVVEARFPGKGQGKGLVRIEYHRSAFPGKTVAHGASRFLGIAQVPRIA